MGDHIGFSVDMWRLATEAQSSPSHLENKDDPYEIENYEYAFKQIIRAKKEYENTGNPVHAIDAFNTAWRHDVTIPIWVQYWLRRGFFAYTESLQKESLEICLGLKQKGDRSPKTFLEREKIRESNFEHIFKAHIIKAVFSVSYNTACGIYLDKIGDGIISETTLQKYVEESDGSKYIKTNKDAFERNWFPSLFDKLEIIQEYTPTDFLSVTEIKEKIRLIVTESLGEDTPEEEIQQFVRSYSSKQTERT